MRLNDIGVTTLDADSNGCLTPEIEVVDCDPPTISVDGRKVIALAGTNDIVFAGTGNDGTRFNRPATSR